MNTPIIDILGVDFLKNIFNTREPNDLDEFKDHTISLGNNIKWYKLITVLTGFSADMEGKALLHLKKMPGQLSLNFDIILGFTHKADAVRFKLLEAEKI